MLVNQGFGIMPEILALWMLRQEVRHEFEKKKNQYYQWPIQLSEPFSVYKFIYRQGYML